MPVDDVVLIAVHTFSKQIRLYSMKIDWRFPKPGEQSSFTPAIECQQLTVLESFCPMLDTVMLSPSAEPELSHLHIVPRALGRPGALPSQPRIVVTFTSLANNNNNGDSSYSIVSSWELNEEVPVLDPSFSELESNRKTKKASPTDLKVCKLPSTFDSGANDV